jgi:hypothetical protein
MSMQHVSWADYANINGFGGGALQGPGAVDALNKALVAGSDVNNPGVGAGVGFPLRVESLEKTLKVTTFQMKHLKLFKQIPKLPAYNTVEEHNELKSYGDQGEAFISETETPASDDSTYDRKTAKIKFMGTTRVVSHAMTLVRPAHGDVIANETVNGTIKLLQLLERALFVGEEALSSLQFDGFFKLIGSNAPAANIIDMRGAALDEDTLLDTSLIQSEAPNYGIPTHLHCNPRVKTDIIKSMFPKGRYDIGSGANGMIGKDVKGFVSPAGDVQFSENVFITDGGASPASALGDASKRPGTPTESTGDSSPVDALSQFGTDDAGSYVYRAVAHNDYGSSAALAVGTVAVAAGDKVTFGLTPAGGAATKWYSIYRSKKGGSEARLIARVPNLAGAGETVINDYNADLPFTTKAILWQQDLDVLSWKQLAPMVKIPLATDGPTIKWMQLLYGVPVLYAPGKCVLIKNIGRLPNSKVDP